MARAAQLGTFINMLAFALAELFMSMIRSMNLYILIYSNLTSGNI